MPAGAGLRVPTSDFSLERDHNGYTIRGRDIQTIRTSLAEMYGNSTTTTTSAPTTPQTPVRRKLSAKGRAAIKAAAKKRWAEKKAQAQGGKKLKTMAAGA